MLKNKGNDQKTRCRAFLAFFIVDPKKPIKSTRDYPSLKRDDFIRTLIRCTVIESIDIATLICELAACGYTLKEAKAIRGVNIEYSKNPSTRGKWAETDTNHGWGKRFWIRNGKGNPTQYYQWIDSTAESS